MDHTDMQDTGYIKADKERTYIEGYFDAQEMFDIGCNLFNVCAEKFAELSGLGVEEYKALMMFAIVRHSEKGEVKA